MHTLITQTDTLHLPKSRLATPVATLHRSLLPSTINYQRAAYSQMFNHFMVTHYHLIVLLIVDKINLRRQSYSSTDGRGRESVDEFTQNAKLLFPATLIITGAATCLRKYNWLHSSGYLLDHSPSIALPIIFGLNLNRQRLKVDQIELTGRPNGE